MGDRMHRHLGLGLVAAASTLALAAAAAAQTGTTGQTTAQQTAAQQPAPGNANVVVTANLREERLRNVAQSVSVVTAQKVEQLQAFNFADYVKFVPGLTLVESAPGEDQLILRGLNAGGDASTVAVYIDETPYGSTSGLANGTLLPPDIDAFDMQRIEVDKGPQGTLYGASTLGGLLKFVTNPPDPSRLAAEAEVTGDEVENQGGWAVKGMVNVPLGSDAAFRIVGSDAGNPGFIDDAVRHLSDVNDSGEQGVRGEFLWQPTSAVTVRLTAIGQNFAENDLNDEDLVLNAATGVPIEPLTPLYGSLKNGRVISGFDHIQNRIYNGTVDWNLGWSTLTSSTSYGTYNSQTLADTTLLFNTDEKASLVVDKFTEEDRLASPTGQPLEWLAGFFYTRETADLDQRVLGLGAPFGAGTQVELANLTSFYEEEAGFGTVTYHFTPQFDLAVGGRYAHNDQNSTTFENVLGAMITQPGASSDSSFTYSVAPRWKPTPDTTVYARIASGYQPGGPNDVAVGAPNAVPRTFGPDSVVSYEIGAKADVFQDTLSFDVDAYYIDWYNIQLVADIDNTGVDVNGGRARSEGVEAQGTYTPIQGLTFSANIAYTDARLTTNTNALLGGKVGDRLPFTPDWAAALDGVYNWSINDDVKAFVGATWSYIGDRVSSFSGTIGQVPLPSYNTWDLRAGLNIRRNWTLEVFAKNVGDVRGISSFGGNDSIDGGSNEFNFLVEGIGGADVTIIQPRTIGVTLTARY
jgi:iron complex outermembrane recepter protein